jgi:hypothetical protein
MDVKDDSDDRPPVDENVIVDAGRSLRKTGVQHPSRTLTSPERGTSAKMNDLWKLALQSGFKCVYSPVCVLLERDWGDLQGFSPVCCTLHPRYSRGTSILSEC